MFLMKESFPDAAGNLIGAGWVFGVTVGLAADSGSQ
jgi:hypothetical protein